MSSQARTTPALQLALLLDDHDLFGAIEWTLATARRTGLGLQALALSPSALPGAGQWLRLSLTADEPALFSLLVNRLQNGVDVREVAVVDDGGAPADVAVPKRREAQTAAAAAPAH